MRARWIASVLVASVFAATGCSAASQGDDTANPEGSMGVSNDEVREVIPGPVARSSDAEVWSADNAWADTNTANAKKAGLAWSANSGLSWEQKYRKWISAFEKIDGRSYGKTIRIQTPWGKTMDGPVLECADVAIWLRMTFASWYHLPFYMTGSRNGQTIYFGHFGVIDRDGNPVSGFPHFKTQYRDYEPTYRAGQSWPGDPTLHNRHVGDNDGEGNVKVGDKTLSDSDGAGAYMDELFLNKRAGYLYIILDGNFGSMNLADGANMFHLKPEATDVGDALLERWQKNGIGHTLPLMSSVTLPSGKMKVSIASGSMPRRQPNWEDEAQSAGYFKQDNTGGEGASWDGDEYAKLGGGIRRWRTAVLSGGRYSNIVPTEDRSVYIADGDLAAIAARPARFKELLAEDTPEAARDAALATIESARQTLHDRPASCSARTKREEAFQALYEAQDKLGVSKADTDAQYRKLEDYVLAELEYNKSKTCCWNSTTTQMSDIVMDLAAQEKAKADADGVCKQPTVFKASGGGKYDLWKQHAADMGRAADWKDWSEDEPCAQRDVAEDTLGAHGDVAMCH
jgi:hypothetical protein